MRVRLTCTVHPCASQMPAAPARPAPQPQPYVGVGSCLALSVAVALLACCGVGGAVALSEYTGSKVILSASQAASTCWPRSMQPPAAAAEAGGASWPWAPASALSVRSLDAAPR